MKHRGNVGGRTNVQDPAKSYRSNKPAVTETLHPKSNGKASPCADEVPGSLPEEDGHSAACDAGNATCQHEEASQCLGWRVDGLQNTELEDEDKTNE